jgi:hypothetical protein
MQDNNFLDFQEKGTTDRDFICMIFLEMELLLPWPPDRRGI